MDIGKNIQNVNNPAHAAHFGQVTIQDVEDHVANITQVGGGGIVDEDLCDMDGLHVRGAFIRGLLGTSSSERLASICSVNLFFGIVGNASFQERFR